MAKPTRFDSDLRRVFILAASLFFLASSSLTYALGLGEIEMRSRLNQPMDAAIELTSSADIDLSLVFVTLASQADHQRIGLTRSSVLSNFDFTLERDGRGNAVVRISSHQSVQEPFLEFMLELAWPNGRLLREYTILVDPPITMPATPVTPATPVSRAAAVTTPAQPQTRVSQPVPAPVRSAAVTPTADSYGPIRRNENLWSIAERLRAGSGVSNQQMMLALQRKNPQAFINGNINNLRAGATLAVPSRDEILALSNADALNETRRQHAEWKDGSSSQDDSAAGVEEASSDTAMVPATESGEGRLQITAADLEAVAGTATPGDPADVVNTEGESSTESLNQQLMLASEEAAANQAESAEYQSQVMELEDQLETMTRLLELQSEELASMQARLADEGIIQAADADTPAAEEVDTDSEMLIEETVIETEAGDELIEEDVEVSEEPETASRGIVSTIMDNPLKYGLGLLAAIIFAGFVWSATRQKEESELFSDDSTLASLAANVEQDDETVPEMDVNEPYFEPDEQPFVPETHAEESDPLTEADVYLAYGRIQQAEDVLQAALAAEPDNQPLRIKLLEVYHAAGNVAAFDNAAGEFHNSVPAEDAVWMQVAAMGYAMSPGNTLYSAAAIHTADGINELDLDQTSIENLNDGEQSLHDALNDTTELNLDAGNGFSLDESVDLVEDSGIDDEDVSEGLLDAADEVTTKLDLARAYLDMGDSDGARSILDEVMQEGNDEQKNEAEALITKLA